RLLEPALEQVDVSRANRWIGVAGTVTTLSAIAQELPEYDSERTHLSTLSRAELDPLVRTLLSSDHATRAANPVIHPGRVAVIGGGGLIARTPSHQITQRGGAGDLVVSEHDILDGIALYLC